VGGQVCPESKQPCISDYHGIPRLLFGQSYWGELGSDGMQDLLRRAERTHWRTALEEMRGQPVAEHLLSPIRADFLHAFPWQKIRRVLDVGAGMGFMSCDMAAYAENVISLEAVPERARFIQLRAQQDGLRVYPIIASAMQIPFPPESFDLITLNGVFEYIGLWGKGDPTLLQEKFLRSALRLLRPGGYLYVGIETRFSMSAILGGRDHSGLSFTSLMPRQVADWYCRFRAQPHYGSERPTLGYRTYTHTPARYARMFREAGFAELTVYGVYDGYNRQRALYEIGDYPGRRVILRKLSPPASFAGRIRRAVENNRLLYRTLEREVVIFARRNDAQNRADDMPWAPEAGGCDGTVAQISLPLKILGIVHRNGVPSEVLEIEKKDQVDAGRRLKASHELLTLLESAPEGDRPPDMRWPQPRGKTDISGRAYWRYEYVEGETLSSLLLPATYSEKRVLPTIERAIDRYVSLCEWMSRFCTGAAPFDVWNDFEKHLEQTQISEDIRSDVRAAVDFARRENWVLTPVHGDFTASNLLVPKNGKLVLIDWEQFMPRFPIGTDLIRFHQDVLMDSDRLPPRKYRRLERFLRETIEAALRKRGYDPEGRNHLRALYLAHQILVRGGEKQVYGPLLKAYREGPRSARSSDSSSR